MRRLSIAQMFGASLLLATAVAKTQEPPEEPTLLEFVHDYAAAAGLGDLKAGRLTSGAAEIRIWTGFGVISPEHSVILTISPDKAVQGRAFNRFRHDPDDNESERVMKECKSGLQRLRDVAICDAKLTRKVNWAAVYKNVERLGITTLPDESALPQPEYAVLDGASIVVEIATSEGYRAYSYSNPIFRNEPEAKAAAEIMRIVGEVFY